MALAIVARSALSPSSPRAKGAAPVGFGLTAQRAQASGYHAKNTEKRSLGPGIGRSGRARPHSTSLVILLSTTTTPTRCQESICLVYIKQTVALSEYKYEQHAASLLWYDGPRRFMPRLLAETTAAFEAACLRHG
jgi:hypothetical protein